MVLDGLFQCRMDLLALALERLLSALHSPVGVDGVIQGSHVILHWLKYSVGTFAGTSGSGIFEKMSAVDVSSSVSSIEPLLHLIQHQIPRQLHILYRNWLHISKTSLNRNGSARIVRSVRFIVALGLLVCVILVSDKNLH